MTPIVSAQNCLYCNNGLTNYLYVGVVLNLTNQGPKQVIALPFNSPEYPNEFTHPLFVFSSLFLSLSLFLSNVQPLLPLLQPPFIALR